VVIRFEREKNSAVIVKEIERLNLRQKLLTDELTSISNRTALRSALSRMVNDESENHYLFVMSDLDNFKMLNDQLGHDVGDQCLKIFANILRADCPGDTPFRFGGDEFCILFQNQTPGTVLDLCSNIQSHLTEALSAAGIEIPLTASFGIAVYERGWRLPIWCKMPIWPCTMLNKGKMLSTSIRENFARLRRMITGADSNLT
jgi:diguanylate cyclase